MSLSWSHQTMLASPVANTSRSLSPTSSTIALEVEPAGDAALDRADHLELADARVERLVAPGDLRLERSFPAQGDDRRCDLAGEHRQQVAFGVTKATDAAVDIAIEVAEQCPPGDERRDQAAALIACGRALGATAQACPARAASFVEPGRDRGEQRLGDLARRHPRAGEAPPVALFHDHQDSLRADETGRFRERELVQRGLAAQRGEAQARADQASQRLGRGARILPPSVGRTRAAAPAVSGHDSARPSAAPRPGPRPGSA